jgi:hypothetical protein
VNTRTAGIAAALTAILIKLIGHLTDLTINSLQNGSTWVPHLQSVGHTTTVYLYLSQATTFLLAVPFVAILGFWTSGQINSSKMHPKIMATFAIGGGAGFIIGTLPVILTSNSPWGPGLFLGLVIMLCVAAATAVQFSLLGLSGAALAEYRDVSNRKGSREIQQTDSEHPS